MGFLDRLFRSKGRDGRSQTESFVVVCVLDREGIDADHGQRLRNIFDAAKPLDWWYFNPGTFQAFFTADLIGRSLANELVARIERLKTGDPSFKGLGIGRAEGELLALRDANGVFKYPPAGDATVQAMMSANRAAP